MKTSELIASAIQRALRASPRAIGAHLSPVGLGGDEVLAALRLVRKRLGKEHLLVGSAPDIDHVDADGLFSARDERAAERATQWRNEVDVKRGQRLVYVSVEEHGKASGLVDCLEPVSEPQIAEAFLTWCDSEASGLPAGIAAALRGGGVIEGAQLEDLCAFAAAVERDPARSRRPWEVIGRHLPLLALARDSGLGGDDTAERLGNNARLVRALATGEVRRRNKDGPLAEIEARLTKALHTGDGFRDALASVDLRAVGTGAIAPKGARLGPRKEPKGKKLKAGAAPPGKPGKKGAAPSAKAPKHGDGAEGGGPARAPTAPAGAAVDAPAPAPQPVRLTPPKVGAHPAHVSAPPLMAGVEQLFAALLAGDGAPVELAVREGARRALARESKQAEPRRVSVDAAEREVTAQLRAWRGARAALIKAVEKIRAHGATSAAVLVGALPRVAASDGARSEFDAFAAATDGLYRAALRAPEQAMREVLALDTAVVRDADGGVVRAIGPLHPLWFGQAIERSRLDAEAAKLGDAARRALARTRGAAPSSPAEFPEVEGADLSAARSEAGLIVFERVPVVVEPESITTFGEALMRRYLALAPHAALGCRVAYEGDGATSFIEGVAKALAADEGGSTVEVLCAAPPEIEARGEAARLFQERRIRLGSIPLTTEDGRVRPRAADARPHIIVRVPSGRPVPSDAEPSANAAAASVRAVSPARTRFELRERSLRITTSIAGVPHLEAFEALHAAARGRRPTGAFTLDASGLALRAEVDATRGAATSWHAVIAPSLGSRPPMGTFLLAQERVDDRAVCAVVSREVRIAVRSLQEGLARVGIIQERPSPLRQLAARIARSSGGLISLRRDNAELLTGALLGMELARRTEGRGVVVPLDGHTCEALSGLDDAGVTLQVALAFIGGALRALVGAVVRPGDLDLAEGKVGGVVGERLHAVVTALQSLTASGLAAQAARDALGWLVWPALAGMEEQERPVDLVAALSDWARVKEVAVEALALVPPGFDAPKGKQPKVARSPLSIVTVDAPLVSRLLLA